MAIDPEMPRTQTSAPAKPPRTTEDAPRREPDAERSRPHHAEDDPGVGGDRLPKGFDEPGAGL